MPAAAWAAEPGSLLVLFLWGDRSPGVLAQFSLIYSATLKAAKWGRGLRGATLCSEKLSILKRALCLMTVRGCCSTDEPRDVCSGSSRLRSKLHEALLGGAGVAVFNRPLSINPFLFQEGQKETKLTLEALNKHMSACSLLPPSQSTGCVGWDC